MNIWKSQLERPEQHEKPVTADMKWENISLQLLSEIPIKIEVQILSDLFQETAFSHSPLKLNCSISSLVYQPQHHISWIQVRSLKAWLPSFHERKKQYAKRKIIHHPEKST